MKKYGKDLLLIVIGIILGLGVVSAAGTVPSSDVTYSNSTVEGALNDLYGKADIIKSTTASAGNVLSGTKFVASNGTLTDGTMTNRGAVSQTINPGGSYTIPAGYHNGSGKVTANANQNSGTYTPTERKASIDMGATNTYRYVNTNSVPNTNSGTYTYAANSTGGTVDLGATNTYRYVNAENVYKKGKADGNFNTSVNGGMGGNLEYNTSFRTNCSCI